MLVVFFWELQDLTMKCNEESWEIITPTVKVLAYVYHPASGSNPGFGDLKFPKDVLVSYTHVLLCTHNPFH